MTQSKKLIGYSLKPECKHLAKAACEIVESKSFGTSISSCSIINLFTSTGSKYDGREEDFKKLEKAGVLSLWFNTVYESEYKVSDWVITKGYSEKYDGIPLQISRISGGIYCYFNGGEEDNFDINQISRLATKEEIEKSQKLFVDKYEIKFEDSLRVQTTIDGHLFTKKFWESALEIAQHRKADIIVGCGSKNSIGSSNQWKLPLKTIEKVLEKLNEKPTLIGKFYKPSDNSYSCNIKDLDEINNGPYLAGTDSEVPTTCKIVSEPYLAKNWRGDEHEFINLEYKGEVYRYLFFQDNIQ